MTRQFNFIDFLQDMQDNGNILRLEDVFDWHEDGKSYILVRVVEFFTVGDNDAYVGFSPVYSEDDVAPIYYRFFRSVGLNWHLEDQFNRRISNLQIPYDCAQVFFAIFETHL